MYYRGIGERIIPFASVYLNKDESRYITNELINAWNNGEKGKVREYIDGAYEVARYVNVQGNILDGTDKELSATRGNDRLGSKLSRLGRYYYTPDLYSKVKRADRGEGKVDYSLREATGERLTPAMIRHHMMENVTRHHELMRYTVKVNNLLKVFVRCFAYYILIKYFCHMETRAIHILAPRVPMQALLLVADTVAGGCGEKCDLVCCKKTILIG